MDTIGERIRFLRKKHGMLLEQMATSIGKSKSNISGYENNKFEPSAQTIIAICKLFDITTDWLLLGDDNQIPIMKQDECNKVSSMDLALLKKFEQLDKNTKIKLEGFIEGALFSFDNRDKI